MAKIPTLHTSPYVVIFVLFTLLCVSHGARSATFTVTSMADVGAGTLRQAITDANANFVANTCVPTAPFNSPGGFIFSVV